MKEDRRIPNMQEVTIGALLHDIGKLMQRAAPGALPRHVLDRASDVLPVWQGRPSHWHALWSDAFFDLVEQQGWNWPKGLDPRNIRDLAVYHHKPLQAYPDARWRAMTGLVTVADRLASGYERRPRDPDDEAADGGRQAFRRQPLSAITTRLKLDQGDAPADGWHLPAPLNGDNIMPVPRPNGDDVMAGYKQLWDSFITGWPELVRRSGADHDAFEQGLLSLLEELTWAVPSSTMDQPDIPLFDHSRAVAAFAAALYHHHALHDELCDEAAIRDATRPRFRFLVGDLSGLQATLFRLASEGAKGLSKTLRGRSFRFQLIADAAARRALAAFEMPFSAALQLAGGRFLLLLPELGADEMARRVDALQAEMDDWLAGQYCGDLGLGLALSDPFAAQDLVEQAADDSHAAATARANAVRDKMRLAADTAKLRQMQGPLARAVMKLDYPHGACLTCGVRPARHGSPDDPTPRICDACDAELRLGQRLPKAGYVSLRPAGGDKSDKADRIFGLDYLMPHGDWTAGNGWRIGPRADGPAPRRLARTHVPLLAEGEGNPHDVEPVEVGEIKTFEMLAHDATEGGKGRKMLAVLKADVDRLGMLFAHGTGERWSLARNATLSRMIDAYFSVRLPELLGREFPNIYTVYAGGDDLMLVAPWPDAFAFADRLAQDFAAFSRGNKDVTLSAGIALFGAKTPITLAAAEAESRLDAAKAAGRNRINAITGPMPWADYQNALIEAEALNNAIRSGQMPVSMAYRLLALDDARTRVARWHATNDDAKDRATAGDFAWRAKLGYQLARIKDGGLKERILKLFGLDQALGDGANTAVQARFPLTLAIYRNR